MIPRPGARRAPILSILGLITLAILHSAAAAELDCLIQPDVIVEVASPVDGVLEEVMVDTSDRVKKGQVLAKLESSLQEAAVAVARGRAAVSDNIEKRKANLEFARSKLTKIRELHANHHVSDLDRDKAEVDVSRAETDLHQAQSEQHLAALELKRAEVLLKLHTILSPVDGVVVERLLVPGESVKDKALIKIAKIDPLRVTVIVPGEGFGQVKPGDAAEVLVDAPLNKTLSAAVTAVDRIVDAASGSFGVRLALPNADYQLPSGLKCQARLAGLQLPEKAIPPTAKATGPTRAQKPVAALTLGKP